MSDSRCTACDICIRVCPTNVFDRGDDGIPTIARQDDCQTCFMCEAWCPEDALFVAPQRQPLAAGSDLLDEQHLVTTGLIGSYRREIGWGPGRVPSARSDAAHKLRYGPRPTQAGPTANVGAPPVSAGT